MKPLYGMRAPKFALYSPAIVEETIAGVAVRYVGQVMSMETPESTYMVRQVPLHPGTLIEVKKEKLSEPLTKAKRYWIHYAEVEARRPISAMQFPVDMLRRCNAAPVNFLVVEDELTVTVQRKQEWGESKLLIASAMPQRIAFWCEERWETFGWRIVPATSEEWKV